jgi:hypothetical protein
MNTSGFIAEANARTMQPQAEHPRNVSFRHPRSSCHMSAALPQDLVLSLTTILAACVAPTSLLPHTTDLANQPDRN